MRTKGAEELQEHDQGAANRGERARTHASAHHQRGLRDPAKVRALLLPQPETVKTVRSADRVFLYRDLVEHCARGARRERAARRVRGDRLEDDTEGGQAEEEKGRQRLIF